MFVTCMNEIEKDEVVKRYTEAKENQTDIANHMGYSRRTIQRVLQERGLLNSPERFTCTVSEKNMLAVATQKHQIPDATTLDRALSAPALTHANVLVYLCKMDDITFENAVKAIRKARSMQQQEAVNA